MLFGLVFLILTPLQVSSVTDGFENLSGRTFPYIISGMIILLGGTLTLLCYLKLRRVPREESRAAQSGGIRKVAVYVGAITLYALGMGFIGYVVSTAAMLVYAMWVTGARAKRVIAATINPIVKLIEDIRDMYVPLNPEYLAHEKQRG